MTANRSYFWILGNMIGWAIALPVIYLGASSGPADFAPADLAIAGITSGVAAGLLLGLATGITLRWMPLRTG